MTRPERFSPSECQRCHDKPVSISLGFCIPLPPQPRVSAPGRRGLFPHRGRRAAPRGSAPSPPGLQGCELLPPAAPALAHVATFPEHTPEGVPGARDSRSPARSCRETRSAAPRIRADAGPRAKSPRFSDKLCLLPARDRLGEGSLAAVIGTPHRTWTWPLFPHRSGKMQLTGTSLSGGWCEGARGAFTRTR